MAVALRRNDTWLVNAPEPVGKLSGLLKGLQSRSDGSLLIGFDFPIGLPLRYAKRTPFTDFRHALRELGKGEWSNWYDVAENKNQISVYRPFYPMRPGGTRISQLCERLNIKEKDSLLRICERATDHRKAACMLFWTLGGNQVGKAAISGWREVIVPNLDNVGLWPFDGALHDLLQTSPIVLAETYPRDVYDQLGITKDLSWSKRRQEGRQSVAQYLLCWLLKRTVGTDKTLGALIKQGFGAAPEGEDKFDATVGLFGMLDVIDGHREEGAPTTPEIRRWDGWILGQTFSR